MSGGVSMLRKILILLIYFSSFHFSTSSAAPHNHKCVGKLTHWQVPNYEKQKNVLGYEEGAFKVSSAAGLIVKFWIDVYTKYSTHHGIIHNLEYPEIVYEVVDFTDIDSDETITEYKKEEKRNQLVRSAKERILFSLNKLAENDDVDATNSYDRRIIEAFKAIPNPPSYHQSANMKSLRFQLGQSDRMKEAIQKSGRYLPMMEEIFRKEGLPKELTRIVFVESSFNVNSYSKVGASGLWQIMPYVAKGNLKMNSLVDYRNHPVEATKLAAKILKFNYLNLGSWSLAVTAYNHGTNGVKRLTEINQTKDLYEIIDSGTHTNSFGFASRNFYYSFLAALEVEKSVDVYFSDLCKLSKIRLVEASLPKPMKYKKFVEFFNGDSNLAYSFNPHFQKIIYENRTLMPKRSKVLIPESSNKGLLQMLGPTVPVLGTERKYSVGRGDTLIRISRQFKVSVDDLLAWNDLDHPNQIRSGQSLVIAK
jgi:membrane-bound lytic murein transglycosylase D